MAPQNSSGLVWETIFDQSTTGTARPPTLTTQPTLPTAAQTPVKSARITEAPPAQPPPQTPQAKPPGGTPQDRGLVWETAFNAGVPATAGQTGQTKGSWLTTPLVSPTTLMGGEKNVQAAQAMVTKQENLAHPVRAALLGGLVGASQSSADILSALTAPVNIALEAASRFTPILQARGIKYLPSALRGAQTATGGGFAVASGRQAMESGVGLGDVTRAVGYPLGLTGPPKATPQAIEQQLMNWAGIVGGTAGVSASAKDALHRSLRNKMGMSDDLASQVADNIVAKRKAEAETAQKTRTVEAGAAQQVTAVEQQLSQDLQNLEGHRSARVSDLTRQVDEAMQRSGQRIPELQRQMTIETSRIVADTTQAMLQKNAELRLRFGNLDERLTTPVATPEEIGNIVREAFAAKGVAEPEIPTSATRALRTVPQTASGPAPPDLSVQEQWLAKAASEALGRGVTPQQVKAEIRESIGNVERAGEVFRAASAPQKGGAVAAGVDSRMVTRVRNDLWDSAATAKDGAVASALYDAYEKLTNIQEKAFEKIGMGTEYKKLKSEYSQFKRGIGSPMMHKLVAAYDAEAQSITPKLAMLTDSTKATAVRSVLKSAAIDTGPLDSLLQDISETEKAPQQVRAEQAAGIRQATQATGKTAAQYQKRAVSEISGIRAGAQRDISAVTAEGKQRVAEAEAKGQIIPSKTSSELEGMSNQELLRMKLQEQADHMRSAGIGAPYAFFNIIYGLSQLARGSPFGLMHLGRGIATTQIPELMRNPSFQDWVLRESEVEPSNKLLTAKIRRSLANLYPVARGLATSGALAGVPYVAGQSEQGVAVPGAPIP